MRTGTRRLSGLIALAAATTLAVGACGTDGGSDAGKPSFSEGFAECEAKPNECNSGERKQGGTIVFAVNRGVQNWNQFSGDGNLVETVLILNTVIPSPFIFLPDGKIQQTELITEAKITSESPQTIVYKINPNAKWDDGTPITADDFTMMWKFQNGKDCPKCNVAGTTGFELISSITGADSGKTVTVTYSSPYPDWQGLFALMPAHVGKKAAGGDLNTPAALEKAFNSFTAQPTWSGWAYKIDKVVKDVQVEVVPNPQWYGSTKPTLDRIIFKMITDQKQNVPALQNKEINGFTAQPSSDMVTQVKNLAPGVNYEMTGGAVWEHIDVNVKNKYLADQKLREAIFTAISVQDIIQKTMSFWPGAKMLGSHNLLPGTPGYEDIVKKVAPDQGSGNIEKAKQILTEAGYKDVGTALKTPSGEAVPELRFLYREGIQTRLQTGELVQAALAKLGLKIKIEATANLSDTLDTYNYDLIIFAWSGNPLLSSNKDLWTTGAGNNKLGWGDPESDRILAEMAKTLDSAKQRQLLNQQDEIMTKAAVVLPLFAKPNLLALSSDYINIRDNNQGSYVTYNVENWGQKKAQ